MSVVANSAGDEAAVARKKLGFGFWLCVGWLGLMLFVAVFTPFFL